ncbi:DUF2182 domain-containing protein [Mesorhizobium xinjiangense]|uniref:DUF2182 domain-containing protein n=1 Tax=Mesorhizobium xinjiangense TaxID=2678685 RepID=UPI0012EEE0E4|nr:DUF2182 domain-containing protein [Mesorhizobium xinjiangense]
MTDTVLETMLRRDRLIVAGALATLVIVSWAYLFWLAGSMDMEGMAGMAMPGMIPGSVMAPDVHAWSTTEFIFMVVMWVVMMIGMMTPSAAPMILLYARVGRQAALKGQPLAATGFFAGGYLMAWSLFSLFATIGQWGLEQALLLTPAMTSASNTLSGIILVAAGLYQWTPQKDACLANCQTPLYFIQRHGGFRRDALGSLQIGFKHGLYCVGCCWALMALLFVGGVMNMLWIAAIAIFVLAEKVLPPNRILSRIAGTALIAAGAWLLGAGAGAM